MERIARNSWGKLLAFVLAFALVLATLLAFLPFTAKAYGSTGISEIWVDLTMPSVGGKVSAVTGSDLTFNAYDADDNLVDIESDMSDYVIEVCDENDYPMDGNDEFELDGNYSLEIRVIDIDPDELEYVDVYIGGIEAEEEIQEWYDPIEERDAYDAYFKLDIEFCTVSFDSAGGTAVDPVIVIIGDYILLTDNPVRDGYVFLGWLDEDDDIFLPYYRAWEDMELTAKWAPVHGVISGDNQTFYLESGDDVVISFDANYDDFDGLWIYNSETGEIVDLSKGGYMVTKGSTVLTLSNALLKTMEAGTYNIELIFEDDDENISYAYATLNIAEGAAPSTTPATPQTGDNSNVIALAGIAGAAAVGLTVIVAYRKKVTE